MSDGASSPPVAPLARLLTGVTAVFGALLLLALAACGPSGPQAPPLPPGPQLLTGAAAAMANVHSASVNLQVDPALSSVPVRSATGKLTSTGEATGTANLSQGGTTSEVHFVITQGILFLQGPTGGYQRIPLAFAASIFDPTALLSGDRGVPALLRTAQNGVTEAEEDVNGTPAYRVRATLNPDFVSSLVPGLTGANSGLVWVDKASSRVVKAQLDVPPDGKPGSPTVPVTVTLSDFDAPVSIQPPS
ncbi:MAG TPA: LppX_LprAFG lipoprotein [Pseudonocardia sp.]|nr:LppX_LprAFG lipoprotein [Pseudonocardia sp.]